MATKEIIRKSEGEKGGKMLTIFKNGRFDVFLERLSTMTKEDFVDKAAMKQFNAEFDIFFYLN